MKSKIKIVLYVLLFAFIAIQIIRPEKNISAQTNNHLADSFTVSNELHQVLKTSCFDCHSNNTVYPWYANIQPVAWWLNDHVIEGKDELNFDEMAAYAPRRQYKKFEEIAEMINENEMPLTSYTFIHGDAQLSEAQKKLILDWCSSMQAEMKKKYTPEQLKRQRPQQPSKEQEHS